ncbi:hypothetical protein SAMN04487996_11396 [Dyadobacter soli]|uniref:Uncharacterized protein n=1 Tax=Dyadobacter soli TaxID=659014 RepID=A0A1G7PT65_9BACT|nr:hypothetical protein SAMN04487996_11396 [Dyadobacter soli]
MTAFPNVKDSIRIPHKSNSGPIGEPLLLGYITFGFYINSDIL